MRYRPLMPARGFTLLEVLIAVAVLAIALGAAIHSAGSVANTAAYLRTRTIGDWVARNRILELQLAATWPPTGGNDGTAKMAGEKWDWHTKVSGTPDPDMRKVEVTVHPHDQPDGPETALTGYIGRPQKPAP